MYNLYLLLVVFIIKGGTKKSVACLAGSYLAGCLVYFWFVVEIQWRKSSEVKDVGGVKRTFYTIIHGLPTGLL